MRREWALPHLGIWVAIVFMAWVFLWDNARMFQDLADYSLTAVVRLPRQMKFLEALAIGSLAGAALVLPGKWTDHSLKAAVAVVAGLAMAAASTLVAIAGGFVAATDAAQATYAYFGPLLLGVVLSRTDHDERHSLWLMRLFVVVVVMESLVAWYQLAGRGYWGDDVHGAMRDAHVFANAVWLVALWMVARLLTRYGRSVLSLGVLALVVPVGWAAANQKGFLAFAAVCGVAVSVRLWHLGWAARAILVTILGISGAVGIEFARGVLPVPTPFARLDFVVRSLPELGIARGYAKIPRVFSDVPHALLIGSGPGSYGSATAVEGALTGRPVPPLAARYTAESYRVNYLARGVLGSFVEESTDVTAFVVEFGLLASVAFVCACFWLILLPATRAVASQQLPRRAIGEWLLMGLAYLFIVSAGTAFYGWAVAQTSTVIVVGVGGLLGMGREPVAEERRT